MRPETANILAILDSYIFPSSENVAKKIADDFKQRRIEKGITREAMAEKSEVPLASIARFEQKGLISLNSLIALAMALGYLGEVKNIFSEPKFDTMEELASYAATQARRKQVHEKRKQKNESKDRPT